MTRSRTGTLVLALLAAASGYAAANTWQLTTGMDPATYQQVSVLSLDSNNQISDEYAVKEVTPQLEFRCTPGSDGPIIARINWHRFISSFNTEVTFAADGAEPLVLKMAVDRTNKITTARNAEDVGTLINALKQQDTMTVEVTPYSEVPVAVYFSVADAEAAFGRLTESCHFAN